MMVSGVKPEGDFVGQPLGSRERTLTLIMFLRVETHPIREYCGVST